MLDSPVIQIVIPIVAVLAGIKWWIDSKGTVYRIYILYALICFIVSVITYVGGISLDISYLSLIAIIFFLCFWIFTIRAAISEYKAKKVSQSGRLFTISLLNDTSQTLTVYFNHDWLGDVNPHGQIDYGYANWDNGQYNIKAKTIDGNTIYDKSLSRDEMERIAYMAYRVTIKPASYKR